MSEGAVGLDVSLTVDLDGLVGDPYEFEPSLSHYGNFGDHYYRNSITLTPEQQHGQAPIEIVGHYTLPPLGALRGDEAIIFDIFPRTRHSGQASLDATESEYTTRTLQSGSFAVPVVDLLTNALEKRSETGNILSSHLYENEKELLFQAKRKELGSQRLPVHEARRLASAIDHEAAQYATKGQVTALTASVSSPTLGRAYANELQRLRDLSERDFSTPLLYGTQRMQKALEETEQIITRHYCNALINTSQREAAFPNGMDEFTKGLHMPFYASKFGTTLPIAFFTPRHHARLQAPKAVLATEARYQQTEETRLFYERCAVNACNAAGLSAQGCIDAVRAQHANWDTKELSYAYHRVLIAKAKLLQAFPNAVKYMADYRVPNAKYLAAQGEALPPTTPHLGSKKHGMRKWCTRLLQYAGSTDGPAATTTPQFIQTLESFDDIIQNGQSDSGDCEDTGNLATIDADEVQTAGLASSPSSTPLLAAFASVLERYDVCATGASVTTPFLDTTIKDKDGKPTAKEESNGHVYAHGFPRVWMRASLKRLDYDVDTAIPAYLDRHDVGGQLTRRVAAWEYALPVTTIEGTGPGTAFLLPSAEMHPNLLAANTARRAAMRAVPHLGVAADAPRGTLSELARTFQPEELPEHDEVPTKAGARVSSFYQGNVHLFSATLFALDPRLAHLIVVDTAKRSHGVETERLLRDRADDPTSKIALMAPYREATDAEVKTLVDVASVLKNMEPATSMGRFPPIDRRAFPHSVVPDFARSCLRVTHPLSDATFAQLSHFKVPKHPPASTFQELAQVLDHHSLGLQKQGKQWQQGHGFKAKAANQMPAQEAPTTALAPHLDRLDRSVLNLQAPAWKVTRADMEKLDAELKELYDKSLVVGHAFWRERLLDQCDDMIKLALVVPVKNAV